ncbi:murein hydrolase activator EnvC [Aeromonas hydrophila]|uniref:Nonpeptidase homolog, peptidase M23B family n=1 Tax=Aeromonas hydrophila subsp. hydrophila (strain ATCC 7966 / DSM 30187 / BCRC 13018 / CCUG 14551 / JCM 1027 / KCTC 2358 / NCIMB 9240 / NCTC 8049) TaxID=380703 RepID=A0KF04_AERHH|nr:murein hydrolase activator EnvC [Aeromonas hydrophila]ABK39852.1 nonpeptidase homolog, peptidase M23B family [Aeromonas hydrophila subsp. hydrophila ATCC 7966]MBS4673757.1 peptidoglycan DD-metalloendopeptidase family protein [Aeromonas hydrophila]OOD35871.1 peptidase M23 [Aeromonas hydrophila]SUU13886.1 M23B family non-peptidase [Aeromonas hydrophila]
MRGCEVISTKTSRVGLLAGALFFCLSFGPATAWAANQQLGAMQSQIKEQQQTIKLSRQELAKLNTQLKADEQAISAAAAKLEQTKQQLRENQQKLVGLQQDKLDLEQQASHQKQLLAKQAESAFTAGNHDYLKLLLNQQDPAKLSRSLDYYDYLNKARIEAIEALRATRTKLAKNQQATKETESRLQSLLSEQQQHHQSLLASQQSRAKVRNQLQQSVQDDEQKLSKLVKAEKTLKARLEELRRQREEQERRERAERERLAKLKAEQERQRKLAEQRRAEQQQPTEEVASSKPERGSGISSAGYYSGLKTNGSLRWPVQGPILIAYGSPRTAELKWKGTLIGASEGTQVKAVAPGQVVYADWLDGFGMLLVIDHGRGYMSLYGHNQSLLRQVGQNVEQGEPVALVGDSGGQDRPGLYFEIRYQGEAINPTKWLAKR